MQAAEHNSPVTVRWDFLGLFALYSSIFVALAGMEERLLLAFREFTASAITSIWGALQVPIVCAGTQLTFAGFRMDIVLECTALHYMLLFAAGVLAFRAHDLPYRAAGVIMGILAIFLLNIARIGAVGFVGRYYTKIFAFVHDYLWQGTFALCVVLLWVLWVNGRRFSPDRLLSRLLVVSAAASCSFLLAALLLSSYVSLLAVISNFLFPLLSPLMDVPQHIVTNGRLIGYVVGQEVTYSDAPLYFLNAALLPPLAAITFVCPQWRLCMKRLGGAVFLLAVQHLLVVVMDWLMEASGLQALLIWLIVMTTFISPLLIWLAVINIFRDAQA